MKKVLLVLSLVLFGAGAIMAQRTISGTVTDESGEPLIGASVLVKGTTTGAVTDLDGTYSISVPSGSNVLVFSYTGFETKEITLGASNVLDVALAETTEQLTEVVVTGLGIRKEKKALGYAVTTLGDKDLELRPEADVARVLRGKVAGVDITQTSGLAGSGTNVIIRGYSSISGTNQPLFVVDGVPFNSDTNTDQGFRSGGASASSRFLDLDPNSIAEVSVLKGLSATVLYGEAGRNGVVLITTKNGRVAENLNKKMEITVNQSLFANQIASLPEDQDLYGNGFHNFASAAFSNWGAPFDQPNKNGLVDGTILHPYSRSALRDVFPQYQGARYEYKAYDNLEQFFETGLIANTSLNIASRLSEGTALNFNYGYRNEDGFIPLSDYVKHNFGLGFQTNLSNGLNVNATFNYVTSDRLAPPSGTSFSSNPSAGTSLFSNVFYTPRSVDLFGLEYENPIDKSSIYYRGGNDIQHPLWTLNNTGESENVRRFFGRIAFQYELLPWLSAQYRLGVDGYTQQTTNQVNKGGRQIQDGQLIITDRLNYITDHTLNLIYDKRFGENWSLDGTVGLNIRRDTRDFNRSTATQQFVYGLNVQSNFVNFAATSSFFEENLIGAFATAALGYKSWLYFSAQARNDWTSTLEPENRSILYPSGSVSVILSEALPALAESNTINYLKMRVGYGTSAGYPGAYSTRNVLGTGTRSFITNGGTILNINTVDNFFGNPNLKPEIHRELEIGVEGRFFNNRAGIDLSLYRKKSSDLIIDLPLDPSTGYTSTTVNAAEITNEGIELGVDFTPIRTRDIDWTFNVNFTANEPVVDKLAEGITQILFAGSVDGGNFAIPGEPYGLILGYTILRDEATGEKVLNSAGTYITAPDIGVLGDPNPDYQLNYSTNFTWKGLTFNALMTYVKGGVIYSTTPSTLMGRGILQETDFDRFVPVIAPGVKQDGTPNDVQITSTQHYWTNGGVFQDEHRTHDGTYLKLREVSLSYQIPKKWLENTPFGSASLTFSGQNLWFNAYGFPKGANFDPEVLSLGVGNGRGFELMNVPTSKQWGGSLRVTF